MSLTHHRARLARPLAVDAGSTAPTFKPFVAVPCYGGMMHQSTADGLSNLFASLHASGLTYRRDFMGNESLITRARNRLVAAFRKSDCTHLLFIDADVGFHARDVHALSTGGFDVTVGAYPMKTYGWEAIRAAAQAGAPAADLPAVGSLYAVNAHQDDVNAPDVEVLVRNGIRYIEVLDGATGFMLITRAAIERFIAHYGSAIEYVADYLPEAGETHHMVFQADRDPVAVAEGKPARYLSEDYMFCRRWQMMGGKIHMCLDAKLTHTGSHTFRGDVSKLLEPSAETPAAPRANLDVRFVDPDAAAPAPAAP